MKLDFSNPNISLNSSALENLRDLVIGDIDLEHISDEVNSFNKEIYRNLERKKWSDFRDEFNREYDHEISLAEAMTRAIREITPWDVKKPPIYLIGVPARGKRGRKIYQRLKEAGINGFGGYLETANREQWKLVCPGKAKYCGYDEYLYGTLEAVEVFGEGNVGLGFVAGVEMAPPPYGFSEIDEAVESTLEVVELACKNRVIPMGTNLNIQPGSEFYKIGMRQPPLEFYLKIHNGYYSMVKKYFNGRISGANFLYYRAQGVCCYADWYRYL